MSKRPDKSTIANATFGPVHLQSGVKPGHARTYIFVAFWTIGFLSFISFLQNYILKVHLNLPADEMGRAIGTLTFVGEIVLLTSAPYFGALSDKIGRRSVFALGFIWIAIGFTLYPMARSYEMLLGFRAIMALGAAALGSMMASLLADYPKDRSRGIMAAFSGAANGFGAMVIIFCFSRVPALLANKGMSDTQAGTYTFWIVAGLALLTAIIVFLGLKPKDLEEKPTRKTTHELIKEGVFAAHNNPRLRLAFLESFIARGDVLLIGTFLSAWLIHTGLDNGLSAPEATSQAGRLSGVFVHGAALLWAPIFGLVLDRLDRVVAVIIALGLAVIAYTSMGFIKDPTSNIALIPLVLLGIGEFSVIMSGQTLVAEEAPADMRGSIMGLFVLCGALGILSLSIICGYSYDKFGPGSAFLIVGAVNAGILGYALYVYKKTGYKSPKG